ncbi:MAG: HypC/HybG/HupF family hydrogenase formation chaperone, partial [Actinomycetota bacterium]|nr:HypC/HybG/HupF family hydrogenase formation chaperone [Actinomycetota bacterium]
ATEVLRRAEAWGLATMWLGSGPGRPDGLADHVLWLGEDADAGHDGRMALGYHLLWELTHVCFEHPGLLDVEAADDGSVCVTCADEGLLGEVVDSDGAQATVRLATGLETVSTMLVGPVDPNDLVLVHAGTAITVVEP